jgi:hypothetical protein
MTQLKRTIGVCILACALVQAVEAHAATYYVSTTGSNSNAGTSTKPWKTIAYATSKMGAGDTTYVRGGTYKEGEIRFRKSGTSSAPIKLLAASGASPIIDFVDKASSKQIRFHNNSGLMYPIGWITVEGFQIRNAYTGFKIYNGHDLTIRRNSIQNSKTHGLFGNGTRILIERNKINNNGTTTYYNHGIYMGGTAIKVINNLIYSNLCYGIQVNGTLSYSSSSHAGPEFAKSSNWVISNNTIAYNGCSGVVSWRSTPSLRAENNIFYENAYAMSSTSTQGINFVSPTGTGMVFRNNLAYASGSGGTKFLGTAAKQGTHYTQSGNIVNTLKPAFVSAPATRTSSPNFALPSGSSAIDKGLVLSSAKIAFNGTSRPKGSTYDVGAYEYNGSTSQLVLAAPTTAQAQ